MHLVVGLGNPGEKYEHTRHNVGFLFLDYLTQHLGTEIINFKLEKKFNAMICQVLFGSREWLLVKPQTFMNDSGLAVRKLLDFYHLNPQTDLTLVHDDLDLEFGQCKIHYDKGPRIHNGVNSVIQQIKTTEFLRVRIGIAGDTYSLIKQTGKSVAQDYVLGNFTQEEQQLLPKIFEEIGEKLAIEK